MTSRFISFEGIDGAGKSTHIDAVARRLKARGAQVLCTREPGGTILAERLRELVLHAPMDALTEALIVFAARRDHLTQVIAPALGRGDTVLTDRYADASFAYQGAGRGVALEVLGSLESWVQQGRQPDLTLWFDVDPALAAQRRSAVRDADRFERQDLAFFERVRNGYVQRMRADPQRFSRIDAAADRSGVWQQIEQALEARGW